MGNNGLLLLVGWIDDGIVDDAVHHGLPCYCVVIVVVVVVILNNILYH